MLDTQCGAHDVIGGRYGLDVANSGTLGRAAAEAHGRRRLPVMKHVPGHGRAGVDSHLSLPVVGREGDLEAVDFLPFRMLGCRRRRPMSSIPGFPTMSRSVVCDPRHVGYDIL